MAEQFVPAASIVGMVFTLLISVGVPVALLIIFRKKLKANIGVFFIGCVTFFLFAMVLEQLMHTAVLTKWPDIQNNVWLFAVYGGLAAGVFEEVGRFVAMKLLMKKRLTKENALMYGAGHGGIEAILIAGMAAVSNLATAFTINSSAGASAGLTEDIITQLCAYPSAMFFLSGVERLSAMTLHICLSYIVYRAIKDKKPGYFFLAVAVHFAVDASTLIINNFLSVYALELIVLAEALVLAYFTLKAYKREKTEIISETPAE